MSDQIYRVTWKAGEIMVHAPNLSRAVDVALEYMRAPGIEHFAVELAHEEVEVGEQ